MPLIKRRFYVPCRGEECLKITEYIREKAPSIESLEIVIEDNGLYITMYGYKSDIRNVWGYIKQLINNYRSSVSVFGKDLRKISLNYIVESIGHTVPPTLLIEILKHLNYTAYLSEYKEDIITNASLEKVLNIARNTVEVIEKIKYDVRGKTTKYYIAALSVVLGIEPEIIYEKGLEYDHLYMDEDNKYRLKKEWRKALKEFINFYKTT